MKRGFWNFPEHLRLSDEHREHLDTVARATSTREDSVPDFLDSVGERIEVYRLQRRYAEALPSEIKEEFEEILKALRLLLKRLPFLPEEARPSAERSRSGPLSPLGPSWIDGARTQRKSYFPPSRASWMSTQATRAAGKERVQGMISSWG